MGKFDKRRQSGKRVEKPEIMERTGWKETDKLKTANREVCVNVKVSE